MVQPSFWLSAKTIAVCALTAVIAYLLLRDHTDHIVRFLPFAIVLLCPLMHVFMHAGHRRKEGRGNDTGMSPEAERKSRNTGRRDDDI